jgi:hypothetical protein
VGNIAGTALSFNSPVCQFLLSLTMLLSILRWPLPYCLLLCRVCPSPYHSATAHLAQASARRAVIFGIWGLPFPPLLRGIICQAADLVQCHKGHGAPFRGHQIHHADRFVCPSLQLLGILHGTRWHHPAVMLPCRPVVTYFAISPRALLFVFAIAELGISGHFISLRLLQTVCIPKTSME